MNKHKPTTKGIWLCYRYYNFHTIQSKLPTMHKWEAEWQRSFTLPQWLTAIKFNCTSSACVDHWDNSHKILHRWYITPMRLHTMDSILSPLCWRDCHNNNGNLLHVMWHCKVLKDFWTDVFSLISDTTKSQCTPCPELCLGIDSFPYRHRKVMIHILYAARISISAKWKSTTPPSIKEVIDRFNSQSLMERMLAYKEDRVHIYHKFWDIWLSLHNNL